MVRFVDRRPAIWYAIPAMPRERDLLRAVGLGWHRLIGIRDFVTRATQPTAELLMLG
jgi:hypothetical protein